MVTVYYKERIEIKIIQGKKHIGQNPVKVSDMKLLLFSLELEWLIFWYV